MKNYNAYKNENYSILQPLDLFEGVLNMLLVLDSNNANTVVLGYFILS